MVARIGGRRRPGRRNHDPGAQAVRDRPRPARRQQGHRQPDRRQGHGAGRAQPLHPGDAAGQRLPVDRRTSKLIERVRVPEAALKELIERTAFAMAQQDVRYYLNGLLLDLRDKPLRCVATDGHRLALCEAALRRRCQTRKRQIILPRKGVLELQRLLEGGDREVELEVGRNHMRVQARGRHLHLQADRRPLPGLRSGDPDRRRQGSAGRPRGAARRPAARGDPVEREVPRREARGVARASCGSSRTTPSRKRRRKRSRPTPASTAWRSASTSPTCWMRCRALREEHVRAATCATRNSSALVREAGNERCRHVVMPLRL